MILLCEVLLILELVLIRLEVRSQLRVDSQQGVLIILLMDIGWNESLHQVQEVVRVEEELGITLLHLCE